LIENPRVELLYVVEARQERIDEIKNIVGLPSSVFVTTDKTSAVLKDPKVEAVVITTPTDSHQPLVLESLRSGKKVFCEKPIANDVKNVQLCYETAEKLGLPLFCAFNRRFDPSFVNVETRVKNGEIGPIHVVKTCARDSPTPTLEYLKISSK
jgi:myo-inositol 2-dehydrogenase/D-chiro-inositol 1-dehydrogenase